MKNRGTIALVVITVAFAAFTLGVLLGRSVSGDRISVSVSRALLTAPTEADTIPATTAEPIHYPLDINSATQEELQSLPGIGEVLSQRIVDYRWEVGFFSSTEGLLEVEGIGEKLYQKIQPYVAVYR